MLRVNRDESTGLIKSVQTGRVLFSYAYLTSPRSEQDFKPGTFGADLIILDEATEAAIKEYLQEVIAEATPKVWEGKLGKQFYIPFRAGDEEIDIEAGHYVLKSTTKRQPRILIRNEYGKAHEIEEDEIEDIYSGMIGEAIISLRPFNYNGKKGITCYLSAVCKTEDGTALGSNISYAEAFSSSGEFDEEAEEETIPAAKKGKKSAPKVEEVEEAEEDVSIDSLITGKPASKPASKPAEKHAEQTTKKPNISIDDLLK